MNSIQYSVFHDSNEWVDLVRLTFQQLETILLFGILRFVLLSFIHVSSFLFFLCRYVERLLNFMDRQPDDYILTKWCGQLFVSVSNRHWKMVAWLCEKWKTKEWTEDKKKPTPWHTERVKIQRSVSSFDNCVLISCFTLVLFRVFCLFRLLFSASIVLGACVCVCEWKTTQFNQMQSLYFNNWLFVQKTIFCLIF